MRRYFRCSGCWSQGGGIFGRLGIIHAQQGAFPGRVRPLLEITLQETGKENRRRLWNGFRVPSTGPGHGLTLTGFILAAAVCGRDRYYIRHGECNSSPEVVGQRSGFTRGYLARGARLGTRHPTCHDKDPGDLLALLAKMQAVRVPMSLRRTWGDHIGFARLFSAARAVLSPFFR